MGRHDGSRTMEEERMVRVSHYSVRSLPCELRSPRRTDAKTVSIVALAAFHPNTKVQSAAMHFFLGSDHDADEDDSDEADGIREARRDVKKLEHRMGVGKSGRKQGKELRAAQKDVKKVS